MKANKWYVPLRFISHIPEADIQIVDEAAAVSNSDIKITRERLVDHSHPDPKPGWTSLYSIQGDLTDFWDEVKRHRDQSRGRPPKPHNRLRPFLWYASAMLSCVPVLLLARPASLWDCVIISFVVVLPWLLLAEADKDAKKGRMSNG